MKNIVFLYVYIFCCMVIFSSNKFIPIIILPEREIFNKIARDIERKLPRKIEILVYDLNCLNGDEKLIKKLNEGFYNVLSHKESEYEFSLTFERDLKDMRIDNKPLDLSFIKNQDEFELIGLGKMLNKDAVMISSITIIEDKYRIVWDEYLNKWVKKRIGLYQGNVFSTDNNSVILRLSYYFYFDNYTHH